MKPFFKRHLYLKVLLFTSSKNIHVFYVKPSGNTFRLNDNNYIINPNHIYTSGDFKAILINDKTAESIDPLKFKSKFSQEEYNSAINNKIIKDIFESTDEGKLDLTKIMLIVMVILQLFIVFYLFKNNRTPKDPTPEYPTELRA